MVPLYRPPVTVSCYRLHLVVKCAYYTLYNVQYCVYSYFQRQVYSDIPLNKLLVISIFQRE